MTKKELVRIRLKCPQCGNSVRRIARLEYHRRAHADSLRYLCCNAECGWEGLISHKPSAPAAVVSTVSRIFSRRPKWLVTAAVSGAAMGSVATVAMTTLLAPIPVPLDAPRTAQGVVVPLGETYDGDPLFRSHPLLKLVAAEAAAQPAAADASSSQGAQPAGVEPLAIRERCAWGKPGGNPYKGSVEQALSTAKLPPEIVRKFAEKVAARDVADRLTINNTTIRAHRGDVEFNPKAVAMTYGNTMCLQTRVNFVAGHEEQADLYEVTDANGQRFSVMVPDVCGNVSVLAERHKLPAGQVMAAKDLVNPAVKHLFVDYVDGEYKLINVAFNGNTVPEPDTVLLLLTALAALGWMSRRRRR